MVIENKIDVINKVKINIDSTIKEALKQLNSAGEKCLVVVDNSNKFLATLSDGDVRKAILKGKNIGDPINSVINTNPTFLIEGEYSDNDIKKLFIKNKFDLIPILNNDHKIVKIFFWEKIFGENNRRSNKKLNVPVVIMAGGRGIRMEPFTNVLPKPLVPVQDKPIIEHIIDRFTNIGCNNFYLTINYKGRILKAYFDEKDANYLINFVEEHEPLGTAGSLKFLDKKFKQPFFVTNCDIIVKVDYSSVYEFHLKGSYDVTLIASAKEYIIPYGTCELNNHGHLSHINEKPKYDFLINTGLYVLNPSILELIPKNKFFHITHLIEKAKDNGKKVGVFPIDEDAWIDVGQWAEYKKTIDKL